MLDGLFLSFLSAAKCTLGPNYSAVFGTTTLVYFLKVLVRGGSYGSYRELLDVANACLVKVGHFRKDFSGLVYVRLVVDLLRGDHNGFFGVGHLTICIVVF